MAYDRFAAIDENNEFPPEIEVVNRTGDTMSGDLHIEDVSSAALGVYMRCDKSALRIVSSGEQGVGWGDGLWVQRLAGDGSVTGLGNVICDPPVHETHVATKGYVDPIRLYAEAKVAMTGVSHPGYKGYTPAAIALTAGMWMVQCGLTVKQAITVDAGWCVIAGDGLGIVFGSGGAAEVCAVGETKAITSAMTLITVPTTQVVYPGWFVNGASRLDVEAAVNGPTGYISAIRLAGG